MFTDMKYTPESKGISSKHLLKFLQSVNRKKIPMHSLLIARGDDIILNAYWSPFDKNTLHRMNSVTKSFVGLAIGLLIDEGRIRYTDKVISFFPEAEEYNVSDEVREQTVYDLLTMRTSYVLVPGRHWVKYKRYDRIKDYFENTTFKPRQTLFYYDSPGSYILGVIVERIVGKSFISYLKDKVLSKIGFSGNAACIKDVMGYSWGDSGLLCTSEDLFKVGRLLKNGGRAAGEMLINSDFVGAAISSCGSSCIGGNQYGSGEYGYGYQIWREQDGGFGFHGMGMQYMICSPDKDIIMVCTADTQGNDTARSIFLDMYNDFLLDHVCDSPLDEDEKSYKELCEYIKELRLVSLDGEIYSHTAEKISGRRILLEENPMRIKWMSLDLSENCGTLRYENEQGEKSLLFGLCENIFTEFPEDGYDNLVIGESPDGYRHPCACSASWLDAETFAIKVQMIGNHLGGLFIRIGFCDDKVGVSMQKTTECFLNEYSGYALGRLE